MFDGFWSGIFGGLFGPAIAQWMSRFKYWVIFLVVAFGWQLFFLIVAVYYRGWAGAIESLSSDISTTTLIFILVPIGFGLAAMLVAFLGSLSAPKNAAPESKPDEKK